MNKKLVVDRIGKSYTRGTTEERILDGLSLHIHEGEFVSVIGPSGSGKSTLFHIIGGLIEPASGSILLDGREVTGQKGLISYMPQTPALFPWRTVEKNVILAMEVAGIPQKQALEKAREWLKLVGLDGYERAYPYMLSGGMQQRVAFLRALLSPQEVMCLDEPFGALDALTRIGMQKWLLQIWERNRRTVLFVTHSIEEALFLSDRIYVFSDKPTRVLREIEVPFARPRSEEVLTGSRFVELRGEIYTLMRDQMASAPQAFHAQDGGAI